MKNIRIGYASAEGASKIFLDMLIGRQNADMYQIFKEKSINQLLLILLDNFILYNNKVSLKYLTEKKYK